MLVTCRPSKLDIAGEQSFRNKKGKEIRVKKTLKTRRSYNADDTRKNHYVLLLSECILTYGCNSTKFNSATANISVRVTYQYNGCTKQNKHDYYSISNILFFFLLEPSYFYRHLFILLRPIEKRENLYTVH
jgi:hypothetical protein